MIFFKLYCFWIFGVNNSYIERYVFSFVYLIGNLLIVLINVL